MLGHQTAGVLDEHQSHLTAAEDAVAANVTAIESLAERVKRAELERTDQENAIKAARLDGQLPGPGGGHRGRRAGYRGNQTFIDEDRVVRKAQLALADARAEHARQFGHYQAVRRCATGILRARDTETVSPATLLRAAEQLMVDACDYWLAPAQVALAAWRSDTPVAAERAVLEAVSRDRGRSALLFSLVLARFGRAAAARWITAYAQAQDLSALPADFPAVLDAAAGMTSSRSPANWQHGRSRAGRRSSVSSAGR